MLGLICTEWSSLIGFVTISLQTSPKHIYRRLQQVQLRPCAFTPVLVCFIVFLLRYPGYLAIKEKQWLAVKPKSQQFYDFFLLTFLLLSSKACIRTASSFSRVASVLCRTPSFSSSFCTTSSWASTWGREAPVNISVPQIQKKPKHSAYKD